MTSKKPKKFKRNDPSLKHGYRSGLEHSFAKDLDEKNVEYGYESEVITYVKPESNHRYTLDFIVKTKSGKTIIIETKGRFVSSDRVKHLLIKRQYPDLDIRFVFGKVKQRLSKRSKTTYGEWCERHGFKYAETIMPDEWLKE